MEPYIRDGDHVLTFNWANPKAGDVVVFGVNDIGKEQNGKKVYWVKRIKNVDGNRIFAQGDNRKVSSKVGLILKSQIVGKVLLRY